jgi:hypothetical protein
MRFMETKGQFYKWGERRFLMYQEMCVGLNFWDNLLEVVRSLWALCRWIVVGILEYSRLQFQIEIHFHKTLHSFNSSVIHS